MTIFKTFLKLAFLLLILISCSTIPPVRIQEYNASGNKLSLNVALVIYKEFREAKHFMTLIVANCRFTPIKISVGPVNESLFVKGLPNFFDRVDVYNDVAEIKNKKDYDFILVPDIVVDNKALPGTKKTARIVQFPINSEVKYQLRIKKAIDNSDTILLTGKGTSESSTMVALCVDDLLYYEARQAYVNITGLAMKAAFEDLLRNIEETLSPISKTKSEERALPSSLVLAPRFTDGISFLPNNTLDAGEDTEIFVAIKNDGKGSGYGTTLRLSSDNPKVTFDKEIQIGDIAPGETKEIKIPVKAALDLQDGTVPFQITCTEKRGYDCKKFTLNVQAAHYEKPELVITGYRINDSSTGLGQGNGNGIPENGETIEIVPLVKNNGSGPAFNVTVSLQSLSSSLEVKQGSATIPQILPGQVGTIALAFAIPTTYSGGSVEFNLAAMDIRGKAGAKKQVALTTEINQPSLAYRYRVIDQKGTPRTDIQNGEYGEIEILPVNKGKMEARNVSIELASEAVSFSKFRDEILRIGRQAEYAPVRFPFQVPRVTDKKSADITVKFSQKDFPGISDTINIPIRLVRPEFKVIHQLVSQNRSGSIEQGQGGELLVQVENIGQLDANNVVLRVGVAEKGFLLNAPNEVNLGKVEAGRLSGQNRFPIHVQRSVSPGEIPILFIISEQHFGTKNITLSLNVVKEQAEVVTVKGQERPRQQVVPLGQYNLPPTIAIATPYGNEKVASGTVVLKGIATDDKAIAQIEIKVNGRIVESKGVKIKDRADSDPREREIFENIPLQPGKNVIMVTAYDNEHLSVSKTITVYREQKTGAIWAAVIGVNKYKDQKLNLKYARNDAEDFAMYLRNNMGLESSHIMELYDEKATLRNIKSLLGTQLRKRADKPEDTIFVFFAGHGAPEQSASAKDEDKIRKYILPHDSEVSDLYATALLMDEIANIFNEISAERIIFIIDSCYSGAGGGRTIFAQRGRTVLSDDFLNRIAQGKGRIILTSSRPGELSEESDELKHGYFTYYLLEGLKGKADINGDGIIDIDEISLYLNNTVPGKTNGKQHPVKKGEAEGQVVVGRIK